MTKRTVFRAGVVAVILAAAVVAVTAAVILQPVYATPFRFTSGAAQSSVDLMISNPNSGSIRGTLTLQVVQNGVSRTFVYGNVYLPQGNSFKRILISGQISAVRWARVSNLVI